MLIFPNSPLIRRAPQRGLLRYSSGGHYAFKAFNLVELAVHAAFVGDRAGFIQGKPAQVVAFVGDGEGLGPSCDDDVADIVVPMPSVFLVLWNPMGIQIKR